jgi:hypothetical protein
MSNTELLMQEIETLPEDCVQTVLHLIRDLKKQVTIEQSGKDTPKDIPEKLRGKVSPELFGKGSINGDIVGPFYEEWEWK